MAVTILYAILVVGLLGALFGIALGCASDTPAGKTDERVGAVERALPGLNCGACGYAGCRAYAEAIVHQNEVLTLCGPGGFDARAAITKITGQEFDPTARKWVTQVHCRGGAGVTSYEFEYQGLKDCNALHLLYGGNMRCKEGCLGLGSCVRVCPVDAIDYDEAGKVWVDKDACTSCGTCVDICPTGVMKWVPYTADYIVACNNTDSGKNVRTYCTVGCIACELCERSSPTGGYVIENNLARIEFRYVGDRSAGAEKCPTKCIVSVGETLQREQAPLESLTASRDEAASAGTETSQSDGSVAIEDRPDRDLNEKS
ncbi:MAG: RnfABCDGE type electron transport complex subunit B [Spirochaetota bacterium]